MKQSTAYPKVIIHRLGGSSACRPPHSTWRRWVLLAALLFAAAAQASHADVFTVRTLPAGFDKTITRSGSDGPVMSPIAADFMGNGRLQWYQGGSVISRFPEGGNIVLPSITLPGTPTATVAPLTAVACDVDRDGDIDIVRINQWDGNLFEFTLQVFLNNGSGAFTPGYRLDWTDNPSWNEGEHYYSIVAADFNKDGAKDLAILATYQNWNEVPDPNQEPGKLYIRWNDLTGGFATTTTVQPTGLRAQCRISSADYDRDGDADLYCNLYTVYGLDPIPGQGRDVFIRSLLFTNDGSGSFVNGSNFSNLRPGRLLDFNGDGWADLVGEISTLQLNQTLALNNAAGSFGSLQNASGSTYNIPLGDMSVFAHFGDGRRPSVVFSEVGGKLNISTNSGSVLLPPHQVADLVAEVTGIGAADSDGDGDTDIFVSLNNGSFAFLENREMHTIHRAELSFRKALSGVTALHGADFNLDGREDLLAVTPAQNKLWVMYTQANGTPDTPVFKSTQNETPHSVAVADFDQDGRPDVAYTLPAIGSVRLARNNGNIPVLWADSAIATGLPGVSLLACGEYGTPNGRPDLFTCNGTTGQVRGLYQSGSTWIGQNITNSVSPVPQAIAAGQNSTAPGDEVAYLASDASSLRLRGSHLTAGWTALGGTGISETVTGGQHAAKIIWADATGDSRSKEAIYIDGNGGLSAWLPIVFTSINLGSAPSPIRDIVAVDWDRDGRTDVLAATDTGLCLFHYQRAGQHWTRTELYSPSTGGYTTLTIMDLNQDGYPDVAAAHSAGYVDYLINAPFHAVADFSAVPSGVNANAGQTVTAMEFPITNAARPAESGGLEDLALGVSSLLVEFEEAIPGPNGTWVSTSISTTRLRDYVSKVKFSVNGVPMAEAPIDAGSQVSLIEISRYGQIPLGTLSTPGAPMLVRLELEMTPGAQQTTTRLFVKFLDNNQFRLSLIDKSSFENFGPLGEVLMVAHEPVLVTYVPPPTALQQWRTIYFGSPDAAGNTANEADFDRDGVPNIVEYITGTNPLVSDSEANAFRGLTVLPPAGSQLPVKLRLVMTNNAMATAKVKVTIEKSTNLNIWTTVASRIGGGGWVGISPESSPSDNGTTIAHTFTPSSSSRYYFRLKVDELP